jgi:ketosteroid isomerase-like protein
MVRMGIAPLCAAVAMIAFAPAVAKPRHRPEPPAPVAPVLPVAPVAIDPAAADRETIRARLNDWVAGMVTRDPAAIDKVLASDFQAVTYGGRLFDRAGGIAELTASPDFAIKAVTTKQVDIRLYGDAAVVRALVAVIERRGDKVESVPIRLTQTWIRQNGEWRAVADQATRVEPAEPSTAATPPGPSPAAGAAPPSG